MDPSGVRWDLLQSVHDNDLVMRACPSDGTTCLEKSLELVSPGKNLAVLGTELHQAESLTTMGLLYETDSGIAYVTSTFESETLRVAVNNPTFTPAVGVFNSVLAMGTPATSGTTPIWTLTLADSKGYWFDGDDSNGWRTLGDVTPSQVEAGTGFVGMFTTADLETGASTADPWFWSASTELVEGKLSVSTSSGLASSGTFTTLRRVDLEGAPTGITAVAGGGADIDDDGVPELFIEAYGTGGNAIWMIPGATDKSETRPATLMRGEPSQMYLVEGSSTGTGPWRAVSSLRVGDRRIRDRNWHPDKDFVAGDGPRAAWLSMSEWDLAELAAGPTELEASASGVVGRVKVPVDLATERGICLFGRCWSAGAGTGEWVAVHGDGDRTALSTDPVDGADLVYAGAILTDGDVVVGRGLADDTCGGRVPLSRVVDDNGVEHLQEFDLGVGSADVWYDGSVIAGVTGASAAGMLLPVEADGDPLLMVTTPTFDGDVTLATVQFVLGASAATVRLPADTTVGGASSPILLGSRMTLEGTAMLYWRDGSGQAWLGSMDVAETLGSDEVVFRSGPEALGSPALGMESLLEEVGAPGVMTMGSVPADEPILSTEDLSARFSSWASAPDWAFESPDPTGFEGVLVMVGSGSASGCPFLTAFLSPACLQRGDLASCAVTYAESADPECRDLAMPAVALPAMLETTHLGVTVTPDGDVGFAFSDNTRAAAVEQRSPIRMVIADYCGEGRCTMAVSGGDVNGDGFADLALHDADSHVYLADGLGGFQDAGVDPADMVNFRALVGQNPGSAAPSVAGKGNGELKGSGTFIATYCP